jgi:hypothetical protein
MKNETILKGVKLQLEETLRRVNLALKDSQTPLYSEFHSKTFASAKRSALDCKNELTKLTQSSKYKWE